MLNYWSSLCTLVPEWILEAGSLLWFQESPAEVVHLEKCTLEIKHISYHIKGSDYPFNIPFYLSCTCTEMPFLASSHSAVKEGVLSNLPSGLAPSSMLGLPGPWPRDPDPQLCSSWTKQQQTNCLKNDQITGKCSQIFKTLKYVKLSTGDSLVYILRHLSSNTLRIKL